MSFNRDNLPDPLTYYEGQGVQFKERRGKWRTTGCPFHGGSDSLRVNTDTGAFICMAGCGARGGDVLAYHMALHGVDFISAARELGAWTDDGKPAPARPKPFPAREALVLLTREANLIAVAAGNVATGVVLTDEDRQRLLLASSRILKIAEVCHA